MNTRAQALHIVKTLRQAGFEAFWAGGCVRDQILGREPKDYDVATRATPAQVQALFPRTVDVGLEYGVIHVILDAQPTEVATFRRDREYRDGRRPESVEFSGPEEDARRRDFTINGLYYDPVAEKVIDYVDGVSDINRKVVRAIGSPDQRFQEDYLRLLRAVRLAASLEFTIDPETAAAICRHAARISGISAERIQQELTRLLTESPRAGSGLLLMMDLQLLDAVLPEVARLAGQAQPPEYHPEGDVMTHLVMMLNTMSAPSVTLAYAVLLHDIGKPPTAKLVRQANGTDRIRFDGHAEAGARMAEEIGKRLRLPSRIVEDVVFCVKNHMRFMDVPNMRKATLRKLVGAPTFPDELELHRLDCLCSHGDLSNYEFLLRFQEELKNEPVLPDPWITGHDLLGMGIPEGPEIGKWHKAAYEAQLDGRFSDREQLLEWIRTEVTRERSSGPRRA